MKRIKQYAIVSSDSASIFEQLLNEKLMGLPDSNPDVKIDIGERFTAVINYTMMVEYVEEKAEPKDTGIRFTCEECPYFEPKRKKNGDIDERCKVGFCSKAEHGGTYKTGRACNVLYNEIRNGGMKLCFTESESD